MQFSNSPVERLCQSMEKANEILTNDGGSFDEIALCKRALSSIKSHFQSLFTRLKLLCEQHGITIVQGISNWNVIDTCFGTIQINTQGDVLIDSCVWEKMSAKMGSTGSSEDNSFDNLVAQFQLSLYHHYTLEEGLPLYNPVLMRDFAEENAPGLHDMIFKGISRSDSRLAKEHDELQHQRTVVILHTLAYFRSQKTSQFQKDSGLYLHHQGASRSAMNSGPVLGYSIAPRTHDRHSSQIRAKHPEDLATRLQTALTDSQLVINLLDDFHNIYTIQLPTSVKLSSAVHMASSLVDIHKSVNAIPFMSTTNRHSLIEVKLNGSSHFCRGGIVLRYVIDPLKDCISSMKNTYLETLPQDLKLISPNNLRKQIKEFRVYSETSHDDLQTIDSCLLIDKFEHQLKSMENYKEAINLFYFPEFLSQSDFNNRQGSNACTFISLLLCKSFMTNRNNLFNPNICTLPSSWFGQMALQIVKGNQIHDRVTGQRPINFSVTEAIPHVRQQLGIVMVEESFDLEFCLQNLNVLHSSLGFYLQRLTHEPNVAAIVIINGLTVSFVGSGQGVVIMDSHKHGNYGALVGQSDIAHTEEFLIWLKRIISPQISLCTLTFIQFH